MAAGGGLGSDGGNSGAEFSRLVGHLEALPQGLLGGGHEPRRLEDADVAMRSGVLALRVKAKVFGEGVEERTLVRWHRLEPDALFLGGSSEHAKLALLRLSPADILSEEFERSVGVRDVLIGVRAGVDVQSFGELPVSLEPSTFVVAGKGRFSGRRRGELRSLASDLLLAVLARAGNECLGLARFVLFTGVGRVALVDARVLAGFSYLATGLRAV